MLRRFTSERVRKERRKRLVLRVVLFAALLVSLLFLAVEVVRIRQLRVETVRFDGNVAIADAALWEFAAPHLEGAYLHLFSKRNILIAPLRSIERELLERLVRLKDVSVKREGLHTLVVISVERKPRALWCPPTEVPAETSAQAGDSAQTGGREAGAVPSCHYLDENGLAFAQAPRLTGGTFIVYEQEFPEQVIGTYITAPEHLRVLNGFIDSIVPLGFRTDRVTWQSDAVVISVRNTVGGGTTAYLDIKVPLSPPYDKAFSNLASVMQTADENGEPLPLKEIEYIDVRFENKVFYKKASLRSDREPEANPSREER
jgi:hypothetical protein